MDDLISRQAAIDALHMHLMYRMGTDSNKKRLDDWINGLPSVQETHEECTETHSCENKHTETHDSRREWYMKGYRDGQQRMRGRWIEPTEDNDYWECPVCHDTYELDVDVTPQDARLFFCPNCGSYNGGGRNDRFN